MGISCEWPGRGAPFLTRGSQRSGPTAGPSRTHCHKYLDDRKYGFIGSFEYRRARLQVEAEGLCGYERAQDSRASPRRGKVLAHPGTATNGVPAPDNPVAMSANCAPCELEMAPAARLPQK